MSCPGNPSGAVGSPDYPDRLPGPAPAATSLEALFTAFDPAPAWHAVLAWLRLIQAAPRAERPAVVLRWLHAAGGCIEGRYLVMHGVPLDLPASDFPGERASRWLQGHCQADEFRRAYGIKETLW